MFWHIFEGLKPLKRSVFRIKVLQLSLRIILPDYNNMATISKLDTFLYIWDKFTLQRKTILTVCDYL